MQHISKFYCYLTVLLLISIKTAFAISNCFTTQYPQLTGGTNGDFHYRVFDIDPSGNVALGGSCFDQVLCINATSGPIPIVEYLNSEGLFMWSKQLVDPSQKYDYVASIRFKPDGSKIVALLDKKGATDPPLSIVIIWPAEGALGGFLSDNTFSIPGSLQPNTLHYDSSGGIYIAMGYNRHSYLFKTNDAGINAAWFSLKSTSQSSTCGSFDALYSLSSNLYIAGKAYDSPKCQNILMKVSKADGSQTWTITYNDINPIATMNSLVIKLTTDYIAYTCGSMISTGMKRSIFQRQYLTTVDATTSIFYASLNAPDEQSCLAIYPENSNENMAYAFVSKYSSSGNIVYLARVNFATGVIDNYDFGDVFDRPGNQFFYAKFIDSTQFYLIGTLNNYRSGGGGGGSYPQYNQNMGYFTKLTTIEGLYDKNCDIQPTVSFTSYSFYQPVVANPTIFMGSSQCHLGQALSSIIIPPMTNKELDIGTKTGVTQYTFPVFTFSDTTCKTTFSYTITVTPDVSPSTTLSKNSFTRIVSWVPSSIPVNLYTVTIDAEVANGQIASNSFTVNIMNSCANALIASSIAAGSSYEYIIGQPALSISISPFTTTNPSNCQVTYSTSPSSFSQSIIQWITTSDTIKVYNLANSGLANTYSIFVKGTILGLTTSVQTSIQIIVKHECYSSIITTSTLSNMEYDIFLSPSPSPSVNVGWTRTLPTICPKPTYIMTISGSSISNTLVTQSQTWGVLSFEIVTKSIANVGVKTITITAQIVNPTTSIIYTTSIEQSFDLNITNRCLLESQIIPQMASDDTYYLDNPLKILHIIDWTQTIVACDSIFSYSVNFSPLPSDSTGNPIISYNSANHDISIKTSDLSMTTHSPITVAITGSLKNSLSKSITFNLKIVSPCDDPLFQIPNSIPSDIQLYLSGVKVIQNIPIVTSNASLSFCGSLKQSLNVVDANGLNYNYATFLTWNQVDSSITLQNTIGALQALSPFTLTFTTKHSIYSQAIFVMPIKVFISGKCIVKNLDIDTTVFDDTNTMAIQDYTIYQGAKNIKVSKFIDPIQCGYPIAYALSLQIGGKVPTFITSDFTGSSLSIQLSSNSRADYSMLQTLVLTGSVNNPDSSVFIQTVYIPLNIILVNQGPPIFSSELKKLTVEIGKIIEVTLPGIVDPDKEDKGEIQVISYGGAESFSSFTKPKFRFTPSKTNGAKDMTYTISITLKDDSPLSQSATYTFDLVVTAAPQAAEKANITSVPKSPSNATVETPTAPPATSNSNPPKKPNAIPKIKKPPVINNNAFKAAIDVVGQDGSFNILFSKNIELPTSQVFNNITMKIMVRSTVPDENDIFQIREITNWTMTSLGKDEMKIQIVFQESIKVSPTADYDKLSVKFLKDNMIFSADSINVLDSKEILMSGVPPQLPTGKLAILLGKSTKAASAAVTGAISTNLVLAVVLGVSMKKLWMMVSALQIIVHFPMLKIPLPANFIMILTAVVDIVNLGLLPKVYIKKFLSYFMEDTKSNGENGLVFFALVIFAFVAVLIILARKFLYKYKLIQKLQEKLSRKLFFNPFFRSHLNGYIKFCLAALIALSNFGDQNLVNKVFTILFMGYLLVVPLVFFMILYKTSQEKLDSDAFKVRCEQLYSNIRTDSKLALSFNLWYLLRRLFLAFTITFLSGSALLQGFVLIISSMTMITYMITVRPFDTTNMLYFEISNEVTILCVSYMIFVNADLLNDEQIRLDVGWFVTAIIALNIFANFVNVVAQMMSSIIYKLRLIYRKISNLFKKKTQMKTPPSINNSVDPLQIIEFNSLSPRSAATVKGSTIHIQHAKSYFDHFSYQPKNDFETHADQQKDILPQTKAVDENLNSSKSSFSFCRSLKKKKK